MADKIHIGLHGTAGEPRLVLTRAEGADAASDMTEGEDLDYRAIAVFLWTLLDNIDTASDQVKNNDAFYRDRVERIHRRRFVVSTSDGFEIAFKCNP